ncbi:MAG: hypothetical protein AB7Q45_17680 [Planctomycetaceae bacterium]
MYDRTVIEERLRALADDDRHSDHPDPFTPDREWSVEECQDLVQRIDRLKDPVTKRLTRELTREELALTRRERLWCTVDFVHHAERYCHITDWRGRKNLIQFNVPQRVIIQKWAEMERDGFAIMMLQLKARQHGATTLTELAIGHRAQFYTDVNGLIASARPERSLKMAKMMENAWDWQPFWLVPTRTRRSISKVPGLLEFGTMNSAVSIQHGSQMNGLARGDTPTVVHLSEVAEYKNPESLIEASLLRAIHETPWVFVILESTADGVDNWLHTKWKKTKEDWSKSRSRMCPLFLPWYIGFDLYPTDAWLRKQPIPPGWTPTEMVADHAERAALYVRQNPVLRSLLGNGWRMSREQQWYYEVSYQDAKDQNILGKFLQEMPADDMEAFQAPGGSVFPPEVLQMYVNDVGRKAPWGTFGLVAHEDLIPRRHQPLPSEIDYDLPSIPVVAAVSEPGRRPFQFDLVPVKFQGWSDFNPDGKLIIFEPPKDEYEYGAGIDAGHGLGQDGTVAEVIRKGTLRTPPAQVAEFFSQHISASEFWPFALAILSLYSFPRRQARAVVEVGSSVAGAVQLELRKRGWQQFHQGVQVNAKRVTTDSVNRVGWLMDSVTRPLMLDLLLTALNDQWLEIASQFFVDEMRVIEPVVNRKAIAARRGKHDDRFMAMGMVLASFHMLELEGLQMRNRSGESRMTLRSGRIVDDDPVYQPPEQATGAVSPQLRGFMRAMESVRSGQLGSLRTGRVIRRRR